LLLAFLVALLPLAAADVDKCAGCAVIVDRMFQSVVKSMPKGPRKESAILEVMPEPIPRTST
jgi:hypothetical protein